MAAGIASKSVKLQRPARATVCSHSSRDATAIVGPILMNTWPHKVVKIARLMDRTEDSGVDQVVKVAQTENRQTSKAAAMRYKQPFYPEFPGP
jgi:hypothetical protein